MDMYKNVRRVVGDCWSANKKDSRRYARAALKVEVRKMKLVS